jgi:hypothetical protein
MGLIMDADTSMEMVTPKEFMRRMNIGRTTYHKWRRNGTLIAGRDVFKKGRVIRILWGADLIGRLLEGSIDSESSSESRRSKQEKGDKRPPEKEKVRPPKRKTGINWDY